MNSVLLFGAVKKGKFVIAEEHIVVRKQIEKVIRWNMQN